MQKMIKKMLGFAVLSCFLLLNSCPGDACTEYQDAVKVTVTAYVGVDSIAAKVNDSIVGCGYGLSKMIGSETHKIKFPINMWVQLFKKEEEWKKLSFKMSKNTILKFYAGDECSDSLGLFLVGLESARKNITLIDFSLLNEDGYCWLIEKMDMGDDSRCMELSVGGELDPCLY